MMRAIAAVMAVLVIAACREEVRAPLPPPREVSAEAVGHFCGMQLAEHPGPKGQIHLRSRPGRPVWFTSVRDAIAFTLLPEEARDIAAIYVNDMAQAQDWDHPEPGTWVDARRAWFVIHSRRKGGMGAPEAVPFSAQAAAGRFAESEGGQVVTLDAIPPGYILGSEGPAP